jgi:transcription elongation factor Elf1
MVMVMEITACPVCGSKNIGIGTLGDGIISGLSSWNEVCRNCGYQGASLVFESESEYNKFLEALSNQTKQTETRIEEENEEKSEQNFDEKTSIHTGKKKYLFEFIVSVIFTIVFFIILSESRYIGIYTDIFSQDNIGTIIVYILGSFVGVLLFFFLFIVLVETLYRSIRVEKK